MKESTDDAEVWANIVLLHLWGAVGYLKPGLLPIAAGALQLVVLISVLYARRLEAKLSQQKTRKADDDKA